jgi:SMP-30/Gluconolactonase/LRE-like region
MVRRDLSSLAFILENVFVFTLGRQARHGRPVLAGHGNTRGPYPHRPVGLELPALARGVLPEGLRQGDEPAYAAPLFDPIEDCARSARRSHFSAKFAGPGGKRAVYAFDVQGTKVANMRLFTDMMLDGVKCGPDGMRADVHGNLWISSNAPLGYAGILCFTKEAKLLGRIRLPEVCANLAFGGPKRDRLFMCASTSLYVYQTTTQGAAPG